MAGPAAPKSLLLGLRGRAGHLTAFFRAALALIGAPLAVIDLMLAAFGAAGLAYFCTQPADILRKLRSPAHQRSRGPAKLSAVFVEANTLSHFADILLSKARVAAMFALLGASNARFNARLIVLVAHAQSSALGCGDPR
jgi:hypothetical protein